MGDALGFFAEQLDAVLERARDFAAQLVLATAAFVVLMLLARALRPLVRRHLERRRRPSYTRVFLGLYQVVSSLLSFLIAVTLAFPSVRVVDLLAGLGVLSVAAGFAFKDILENLLAGALLLLRDPFKSGDEIRIGDHEGIVEGITVRETLLRTYSGERLLIPNAQVYASPIEVRTHFEHVRSAFTVEIEDAAALGVARDVVLEILPQVPGVLLHPPPSVVVLEPRGQAILLECRFWSAPARSSVTAARDRAVEAVVRALADRGLGAPMDEIVVHLPDGRPADR